MRFEAAIFDYDGVLVELDRERTVALLQGRTPLPVRTLHRRWEAWCSDHIGEGQLAIAMWRAFWEQQARELGIPEPALQEICAVDCLSLFRLCPDTLAALEEARRLGLRIGVLSNSALPKLASPLAPIALAELADVVRVPGRGLAVKPEREAYLDVARSLGTSPEYCLFFDNDPRFVEAAREVGMRAFLVWRGGGPPPEDPAVVRDLSGLRALAEAGGERPEERLDGGASPAPRCARTTLKVVVTDLDGTLLRSDGRVDSFTAATFREVHALGVQVVLATARNHLDASPLGAALGVPAFMITSNGARVHDPDGARILARDIEPAVARALMSREITESRLVGAVVDGAFLISRPSARIEVYYRDLGLTATVQDLASHDGLGVAKVTYLGREDDLTRLRAEILSRFGERVCVTFTAEYLEVMGSAVSKGSALIEILRRLGVPVSDCAAFGDGDNDLDLLSVAGLPFVMSGASPNLLAAMPQASLAGSNDEAGVARTLRRLLGLPG